MALIRWLLALTILAVWAALIGTSLYVAMYEPPAAQPQADAIVILGGEMGEQGRPIGETLERIARGAELYEAGAADTVIITGGSPVSPEATIREHRAAAVAAGIPEDVLIIEGTARSTLQNALFTLDMQPITEETTLLLVTHRYHLPRAWASYRWAGFQNVELAAADPDAPFAVTENLLWESVKWPFNVARGAAAWAAKQGDVPRDNYLAYLE